MVSKRQITSESTGDKSDKSTDAPGKLKLIKALKYLLDRKDFNSITTAEIAKTAGTNEALIYFHFQDKRDLLHQVLKEYLEEHQTVIDIELKKITGAMEKLKKLIWLSFDTWNKNRIYAKIILIEVRSFPGYFESESYQIVRNYSKKMCDILEEGRATGEIRGDIQVGILRSIIVGAIEHYVLPAIIFNRNFSPKEQTEYLYKLILEGLLAPNGQNR